MRFHDLRHGAASLALALGASPKVIQSMLGHAEFGTTMNVYAHLVEGLQKESAVAVGHALWGAS